ncbi:hypothetical protein LPY66_11335 [Dehalobacter sp. DCM]|uniref:hypothetical protein n=1 Tax=Dehalobacter sp. DCM TaxID=2907827 RepID=UPI0030812D70|nr:hypothetical protein LPY66_11335 [Dehalobacter sp. DCM]
MAGRAEFSSNVIVSGGAVVGLNSEYGRLTVGTTAVAVKAGAEAVSARTGTVLAAHPDNTGYIYLGLDDTVSATNYMMVLPAGQIVTIDIDNEVDVPIYAIASVADQYMGVCEVKR